MAVILFGPIELHKIVTLLFSCFCPFKIIGGSNVAILRPQFRACLQSGQTSYMVGAHSLVTLRSDRSAFSNTEEKLVNARTQNSYHTYYTRYPALRNCWIEIGRHGPTTVALAQYLVLRGACGFTGFLYLRIHNDIIIHHTSSRSGDRIKCHNHTDRVM